MGQNNNDWAGSGTSAAMGILGMLTQKKREERALQNQQKLMEIQTANQKALNEHGAALQLKMWKDTNYPAQMEMLREAGLNPSLLYGMKGSGGTTTGSQSGGSATGGNAPAPMDIGNAIQAATTAAEIKLKEAQARNLNVDADKKEGVDSRNVEADTIVKQTEAKLKEANRMQAWALVNKAQEELAILSNEKKISDATREDKIKQIKAEAVGAMIRNALTKAEVTRTREQTEAIIQGVKQKWKDLQLTEEKVNIEEFKELIKAEYPAIWEVGGNILNKVWMSIEDMETYLLGTKPNRRKITKNKK